MRYDRTIVGYHGRDRVVANQLLHGGRFKPSRNDYDWLGTGIYFWEYGVERARQFAVEQRMRRKVKSPSVVGALIQLGRCFDLMDTRFTSELVVAHEHWATAMRDKHGVLPVNGGPEPDRLLLRLDCAVVNWYLDVLEQVDGIRYDTVRCGFVEGGPVFPGAGISRQSHVQVTVRNRDCIVGVFRPMMETQ